MLEIFRRRLRSKARCGDEQNGEMGISVFWYVTLQPCLESPRFEERVAFIFMDLWSMDIGKNPVT